ncbi:hypothetical protein PAAG_00190 [Paracoccidioides lutzii Pb01]|uniref:Uncharacterized protein n=1 Tax=Paracoccidioides lutzii (strain ATCC MYA-826 / Pb01) TaxID=502779 RepID=C1GNU5_PARBA|nr:hypothetical protein PAAG_00190 [Paracoccidioides lutzii Pb01]EEH35867.2 hypothetical protein PAAG_00190 [Paracoccidioides lutzii Pb01]
MDISDKQAKVWKEPGIKGSTGSRIAKLYCCPEEEEEELMDSAGQVSQRKKEESREVAAAKNIGGK